MHREHALAQLLESDSCARVAVEYELAHTLRDAIRDISRERHLHAGVPGDPAHLISGVCDQLFVHRANAQSFTTLVRSQRVSNQTVGEHALHDELLERVILWME